MTTPHDCALLVAIPTSEHEFLMAAGSAVPGSFVGHMRGDPPRKADWVWRKIYAPIVDVMARALDEVERLGVRVVRAAHLTDLHQACSLSTNITLVAHWRFPGLRSEDIIDPSAALAAVLAAESGPLSYIRAKLASMSGADATSHLVELLCAEVACAERRSLAREGHASALWVDSLDATQPILHRTDLEVELGPTVLRHAGTVEMAGEFRTVAAVIDAIPADFTGVIDLSVCNSEFLGRAIRRSRRHCLAVVHQQESPLVFAILKYRALIRLLVAHEQSFLDASTTFHTALIRAQP